MSTGEMSTEQFCLRWNDFHKTITSTFSDLRDDDEFLDVTLVSNCWSSNLTLIIYMETDTSWPIIISLLIIFTEFNEQVSVWWLGKLWVSQVDRLANLICLIDHFHFKVWNLNYPSIHHSPRHPFWKHLHLIFLIPSVLISILFMATFDLRFEMKPGFIWDKAIWKWLIILHYCVYTLWTDFSFNECFTICARVTLWGLTVYFLKPLTSLSLVSEIKTHYPFNSMKWYLV